MRTSQHTAEDWYRDKDIEQPSRKLLGHKTIHQNFFKSGVALQISTRGKYLQVSVGKTSCDALAMEYRRPVVPNYLRMVIWKNVDDEIAEEEDPFQHVLYWITTTAGDNANSTQIQKEIEDINFCLGISSV